MKATRECMGRLKKKLIPRGSNCRIALPLSPQDPTLAAAVEAASATPLRDPGQRPLFVIAPLDVLVTHEAPDGRNRFHIIEINGGGQAWLGP